jgi:hypothetical protein
MIMTIFDSLSEYWTSFAEAPLGFQLVLGAGAITAFGAAKTGWKMLFPLRWVSAKTLRGTAWLLHHTENAANNASNRLSGHQRYVNNVVSGAIMPETVPAKPLFNCDSYPDYMRTLKYYNKGKTVGSLTFEQLDTLINLGHTSVYATKDRKESWLYVERARRNKEIHAKEVLRKAKDTWTAKNYQMQQYLAGVREKQRAVDIQNNRDTEQRIRGKIDEDNIERYLKSSKTAGYYTSKNVGY